MEPTPGYQRDL